MNTPLGVTIFTGVNSIDSSVSQTFLGETCWPTAGVIQAACDFKLVATERTPFTV
jgi:hypothetical protein